MTLELTTTKTIELNPNFPMYLKCKDANTYFYFKAENEGVCVVAGPNYYSIGSASIEPTIQVYQEFGLEESTRHEFAEAMAKATTAFDNIISSDDELMETEVNYPLNAVL